MKFMFQMRRFLVYICHLRVRIHYLCMQALEQGLGGVVLKVEDVKAVLELKVFVLQLNFLRSGALLLIFVKIIRNILTEGMKQAIS